MALRSGSRNRNGMFDTWRRLGTEGDVDAALVASRVAVSVATSTPSFAAVVVESLSLAAVVEVLDTPILQLLLLLSSSDLLVGSSRLSMA